MLKYHVTKKKSPTFEFKWNYSQSGKQQKLKQNFKRAPVSVNLPTAINSSLFCIKSEYFQWKIQFEIVRNYININKILLERVKTSFNQFWITVNKPESAFLSAILSPVNKWLVCRSVSKKRSVLVKCQIGNQTVLRPTRRSLKLWEQAT